MNHRPRKRFGQNFLRAPHVVEKILAAAELTPGERVMEIGPGLGALTGKLLESGASVLACEVDRDLAAALESRGETNLTVHLGDVLKADWSALLCAPPYKLVANLPYNISSQVLFNRVVRVAPGCFHPPPKVESVVLRFDPRPQPLAPVANDEAFRHLVKAVFGQRRKTLRNGLLGAGYEADAIDRALAALSLAPTVRGETLTIAQMAGLADKLQGKGR
jgi:16S rRNA (adenine1518-N6/adenine1519-N6)-dimethyltransferase